MPVTLLEELSHPIKLLKTQKIFLTDLTEIMRKIFQLQSV